MCIYYPSVYFAIRSVALDTLAHEWGSFIHRSGWLPHCLAVPTFMVRLCPRWRLSRHAQSSATVQRKLSPSATDSPSNTQLGLRIYISR